MDKGNIEANTSMAEPISKMPTNDELIRLISHSTEIKSDNIVQPEKGNLRKLENHLDGLLLQRNKQRRNLFWFAIVSSVFFTFFVSLLILIQGYKRWKYPTEFSTFTILDNNQLELLIVSMFGQFIGIIIIITKSLWDGTDQKSLFDSVQNK